LRLSVLFGSQNTASCATYDIDCVFITEMWSVHCTVRAGYLYRSCFILWRFIWFME